MFIGLGLHIALLGSAAFWPSELFIGGEPGQFMLVDPAYLYQDTAGTMPVTAVGQSVALCEDQSGRGNHDTQPTVGSRPIYGKHPANGYKNMLYGSDTLVTQNVATLAKQKTLSFTGTGTVTLTGSYIGTLVGVGAGRTSLTFTPTAGTLTLTVVGSVTLAMLEDAASFTTYQRTGATSGVAWPAPPSYDITEAGQPDLHYLHFNGVSSFMVSPTITPGIDKAQVFVGIRKLSDAAQGCVLETSSGALNGSISVWAPSFAGGGYAYWSRGTLLNPNAFTGTPSSPNTSVLSGVSDIANDAVTLRVNGTQIVTSSTDQGTGNYLAYPIYTGRRAGTSIPVSMLLYSKIVRFGATLTADTIAATDRWTGQRAGVFIA